MGASADALSAAGATEALLDRPAAAPRRGSSGATVDASAGAQSSCSENTPTANAALPEVPGREFLHSAAAGSAVTADSMAPSSPASPEGIETIPSLEAAPESVVAERIAVRALMAQASVLKQLGRLQEALHALKMAEVFDKGVEVHRKQLQAALLGHPVSGRGSNSGS